MTSQHAEPESFTIDYGEPGTSGCRGDSRYELVPVGHDYRVVHMKTITTFILATRRYWGEASVSHRKKVFGEIWREHYDTAPPQSLRHADVLELPQRMVAVLAGCTKCILDEGRDGVDLAVSYFYARNVVLSLSHEEFLELIRQLQIFETGRAMVGETLSWDEVREGLTWQ